MKNDRAEAERIFQDFAQGVLSGITTVAATAAGGAGLQIANFAQHTGLVARFVELGFRFFSNRRNQAERKEAFIQSVEGVIRTLEIYSSQLGSSNIVASLVTSYTPLIVQHRESINKTKIGEKEKKAKRAGHQFFMSLIATFVSALVLKAFTGLVGGVSKAVVAILRWIKLIGPDAADKATGFPVMWVIWIAVFVVNGYMLARWLRRIRECRDEHTRQEQHITQLRAEIAEVTNRFRE